MQARRHIADIAVCLHSSHAVQSFSGKQARQTRVHTFSALRRACLCARFAEIASHTTDSRRHMAVPAASLKALHALFTHSDGQRWTPAKPTSEFRQKKNSTI